MAYKGELLGEGERCADCEAIIARPSDGHGGSPSEAYSEGYHICAKGKSRGSRDKRKGCNRA